MKPLYTRWGKALDSEHVLEEYPRPLLKRDSYCCLNGYWDYRISSQAEVPEAWDGEILVPFSPESLLSGVNRQLKPGEYLWYQRTLPDFFSGEGRLLLHFGAVDQRCRVYINGSQVGDEHVGGYLPFSLDITDAVKNASAAGPIFLQVRAEDVSDTSYHARGKQKLQRGGMYYTAQSGIWQTVWMEEVPSYYITELTADPDADHKKVRIQVQSFGSHRLPVKITVFAPAQDLLQVGDAKDTCTGSDVTDAFSARNPEAEKEQEPQTAIASMDGFTGELLEIPLNDVRLWDCEHPWLYTYSVTLGSGDSAVPSDCAESYFALRTFTVEKDEKGIPRICLNHKPQFQRGVLDQGYWPDGLMTAPGDDAFVFDILSMKKLGYNMIRKHIKIEPQRWYYHCDRLGMVVWQDMVNGGSSYADWYVTYVATAFSFLNIKPGDRSKRLLSRIDPQGQEEFIRELEETILHLKQHPSIAVWVLFNEGWGQFETKKLTEQIRALDDTRLIDSASGWFDQGCGDFNSFHNYFFPMKLRQEKKRASVLSEFGGYSMTVPGHVTSEDLYGYGTYEDQASLQAAFEKREAEVNALIPHGLCASVYTQVSDIEDEVNGIFTYDREVQKLN